MADVFFQTTDSFEPTPNNQYPLSLIFHIELAGLSTILKITN